MPVSWDKHLMPRPVEIAIAPTTQPGKTDGQRSPAVRLTPAQLVATGVGTKFKTRVA